VISGWFELWCVELEQKYDEELAEYEQFKASLLVSSLRSLHFYFCSLSNEYSLPLDIVHGSDYSIVFSAVAK